MGVVNVTPDSFHSDSRSADTKQAVAVATRMAADGAEWIDVGGESTRPGADSVSVEEELGRVVPAIEGIRAELPDICISVDTRRAAVARQSLEFGADMVNDVSAMGDPGMIDVIVEFESPVCVMHMQGLPENMQNDPKYGNVVDEVRSYLAETTGRLVEAGVDPSNIVADPGIGFGKTLDHNLALLSSGRGIVPERQMGLMWGVSRKSMFRDLLGRESSDERLAGTLGIAAVSMQKEVDIIRVHDVTEHSDAFSAMKAVR